jgi:hypothetical protein
MAPFIASQAGSRPAEIANMFGVTGVNLWTNNAAANPMRKVLGTAYTLRAKLLGYTAVTTAASLYNSGKPPWENDAGFEWAINTGVDVGEGENKRRAYIMPTAFDPSLGRAMRSAGLLEAADKRNGIDIGSRLAAAGEWGGRLAENEFYSFLGGFPKTAKTLVSGKALYRTRSGDMLQVAQPGQTPGERFVNNVKASIAGLNTNIDTAFPDWTAPKYEPQGPGSTWLKLSTLIAGDWYKLGRTADEEASLPAYQARADRKNTVAGLATRYNAEYDDTKKQAIYQELLSRFPDGRSRTAAIVQFNSMTRGRERWLKRNAAEGRRITGGQQ